MTVTRQPIQAADAKPPRRVVDTRDYVRWGGDDQRPQQLLGLLAGSSTGKVCSATKAKFIEGNGLKDVDFYRAVINPRGQTMDALLKLLADREASLSGHALLVNLNLLGNPMSVYWLPTENVRLGSPLDDGRVDYCMQLHPKVPGSKGRALKPTVHLTFDPLEPAEQRAERLAAWPGGPAAYPGEIYCSWIDSAGYYPEQVYEPAEVDMETEARLKRSRRTDIKSGYSNKTVIVEYGTSTPTQEVLDANGKKYGNFVGEDGDRIMLLYADVVANAPTITQIEAPDASKRYETDGNALKADIRAVFQIPTLLYGEATAGKLGTTQEMEDATLYVQNMVVNTNQRSIERTLEVVFGTFQRPDQPDVPLCPSKDYSIDNLSLAPVVDATQQTKVQKTLKALNTLSPLVANGVLGAMSQKQILALVDLEVDGPPAPKAAPDEHAAGS